MALFAAIDCGTTAVKAALFDERGRTIRLESRHVPCVHHPDGRAEQDPLRIRRAAFAVLRDCVAGVRRGRVAALAVTNQRATVVCIGRDGEPLGPAISWQDMRGGREVARLRRRMDDSAYYRITGLPCNPVFSLAKILHLRTSEPERFRRTARFVMVHDYLLHALGCGDFLADHSNASLTGLFDVRRLQWSEPLLALAGIRAARLSRLVPPGTAVGAVSARAAGACGLLPGTPLVAGGGDQQCAGLGAGAVAAGICAITLGTAGVCFCPTDRPVLDPRRRVTCCAHAAAGAWEVEGLQHTAGDCLEWVSRRWAGGRGLDAAGLADVAAVPRGAGGLLFYPYLAGAGAPHWEARAAGMALGLRHAHGVPHLLRAAMEGIALENRMILDVFRKLGVRVDEIRLTGGHSTHPVWNRIQADVYGLPVRTLENPQATLLGAAILAAVGVGAAASPAAAARRMVRLREPFAPDPEGVAQYRDLCRRYRQVLDVFRAERLFARARLGVSGSEA
jgi:xylulokinase